MNRAFPRLTAVCAALLVSVLLTIGATPARADIRSACAAQGEAAAAQIKSKGTPAVISLSPVGAVTGLAVMAMAAAAESETTSKAKEEARNNAERACLAKQGLLPLPGSSASCACAQVPSCTAVTREMTCQALAASCNAAVTTAEFNKYNCAKAKRALRL